MKKSTLIQIGIIGIILLVAGILQVAHAQNGVGVDVPNPLEKLDVDGAIKIGTDFNNSSAAPQGGAGTIRWNGTNFEGWDGTQWVQFGGGGTSNLLQDADTDTKVQVEESADEDKIRFDAEGLEVMVIEKNGTEGMVGVGTSDPRSEIHISDGSASSKTVNDQFGYGASLTITDNAIPRVYFEAQGQAANKKLMDVSYLNQVLSIGSMNDAGNAWDKQYILSAHRDGNVGIGTGNAQDKLHVNGAIRMVDGNQAVGYVPVSNANGTMIWSSPSTIIGVNQLVDADNDTKIQVEESPDEDLIRFDVAGTEYFRMEAGRVQVSNTNWNISYGDDAGELTGTGERNTAFGVGVLKSLTTGAYNTAIGDRPLLNLTSGSYNVGMGSRTMNNKASGDHNIALGRDVMWNNTTGSANIAIGSFALFQNNGNQNVAIGYDAGNANTGSNNVFLGNAAGRNSSGSNKLYIANTNTSSPLIYGEFDNGLLRVNGTLNVNNAYSLPTTDGTNGYVMITDGSGTVSWSDPSSLGTNQLVDADNDTKIQVEESADEDLIRFDVAGTEYFRMEAGRVQVSNTNWNISYGDDAGELTGTGERNTAFGTAVLRSLTTGAYNTAIGDRPLLNLTSGSYNVGMGSRTMNNKASGDHNIALGRDVMWNNTTGSANIAIGSFALFQNNGNQNVAVGYNAGNNNTGSSNVFLGYDAGRNSSGSNKLYIANTNTNSPLIYGEFDNGLLRVNGTLNVNNAYSFPTTDGTSGYVMTTDGSGAVSWADPNTLVSDGDWTINGNNQYSAVSGNVGIGTPTPNSKLDINGAVNASGGGTFGNNIVVDGNIYLTNTNGTGTNNPDFRLDGYQDKLYIIAESGSNGPATGTQIRFRTAGSNSTASDRVIINGQGNLGVATTNPQEKLHVAGSIRMVDGNQAVGYIPVSDANGTMTWTAPTTITTASVDEIVDADNDTKIQVEESADEDKIRFDLAGTQHFLMESGRLVQTNSNNSQAFGSNTLLNSTGVANTAIGDGVLEDNTSGYDNIGIGYLALANNTTGVNNVSIGTYSSNQLTTTSNNTVLGKNAAYNYSGGGNITVIGMEAGLNASGSNNTFIGHSSGSGSSGSDNVFLGRNAGSNVPASNRLYIDNSNTSAPLIYGEFDNNIVGINGNLGVGTQAPTNLLSLGSTTGSSTSASNGKKLAVYNNAAGTDFYGLGVSSGTLQFHAQSTLTEEPGMVLLGNGNTGIGTTTPDRQLNIESATGPQMLFTRNDNNTTDGELMGEILFDNNDDTAPSSVDAAVVIRASASGNQGNSNKGGYLSILTKDNVNGTANATERVRIAANGNVGIGETSPQDELHVEGSIRMVDGNQIAGYIPVSDANGTMTWTNPSTITTADDGDWTINGNNQYSAVSGNVGIGTPTPNSKLDINGAVNASGGGTFGNNITVDGNIYLTNSNGTGTNNPDFRLDGYQDKLYIIAENGSNGPATGTQIRFRTAGSNSTASDRVIINSQGNLGVATTNPQEKLHVAGSIRMVDGNQAVGYIPVSDANGTMTWTDPTTITTASIDEIVDADNDTKIQVEESADEDKIRFDVAGSQRMIIDNVGNVGIGTGSPAAELHVEVNQNALNIPVLLRNVNGTETGGNAVGLGFINASHDSPKAAIVHERTNNWGRGSLHVLVSDDSNNSAVDMSDLAATFTRTKRLGIATSNPSFDLAFDGDADRTIGVEETTVDDGHDLTIQAGSAKSGTSNNDGGQLTLSAGAATGNGGINPRSEIVFKTATQLGSSSSATQTPTEKMRIDANGNVGIGTSNPSYKLDLVGSDLGSNSYMMRIRNTSNTNSDENNALLIVAGHSSYNSTYQSSFIYFQSPDGDYCGRIKQDGNASVNYLDASDIRLKENIRPTKYGLSDLMKIEVADYNYISDSPEVVQTGFLAQQLYTAYPDPVDVGGDDVKTNPWGVDYGQLTPLLVKAIQDQQAVIESLKSENNALKAENTATVERLTLIEEQLGIGLKAQK